MNNASQASAGARCVLLGAAGPAQSEPAQDKDATVDKVSGSAGAGMAGMIAPGPSARLDAGRAAADGQAVTGPRAAGVAAAGADAAPLQGLKGIVRDLAARPPVDSARLAELRLALETGSYRVDPARVADAMIASLAPRA